jgi:hypothetical protein
MKRELEAKSGAVTSKAARAIALTLLLCVPGTAARAQKKSTKQSGSSSHSGRLRAATTTTVTPPSITVQPVSVTILAGGTASFSVAAAGTAPLAYQWYENGTAIGGATSSTYTISATTTSYNGAQFAAVVSNSGGTATSNAALLTVNSAVTPPSITAQPASVTIVAGGTASFSVAAAGTAPLAYQWYENGTAIGGATSSTYTISATTTSYNGAQFTASVSNSGGTATSNAALLTVNSATLLLNSSSKSLAFGNVNVSSSSLQSVTLTNAGNSSVTISNVSVAGAGFNASGGLSGVILSPGQTATLSATFAPATAGTVTGGVTLTSNASNSPSVIALSGTGVAPVAHSVYLSWAPSSSSVTGYNVYTSEISGGPYNKLTTSPVGVTSYTDGSVAATQTYYYVVTAVSSTSGESAYSQQVSATVP